MPVVHALFRTLALALLAALGAFASAAPVRTPNVEAEIVAERVALVPGQTATVALRLAIRERWHTYWQNPGDSGLPTTLAWKLPDGFTAGVDPVHDRARFHVTERGICLVTPDLLGMH